MLLVYGLTQTTNNGWTSIQTIGALAGSAVLMAAFLWIENRSRSPLVPLGFFRRRTPTAANVIGLGLGTMVFGMFFLLSLYMQQVLGFSALKTGVGYLAVALTAVVASGIAQALVTRLGVKPILAIGMGLLGGGLAYFTQVSPNGSYLGDLLPGFLLIGVGLGFSFVPVSIAALAGVTGKDAGLASGLINTSQQIGGALGLAVLATVSTTRTENLLADGKDPATALTSGFQIAFWVGVGLAAASLVATLVALRRKDLEQVPGEAVPVPA
jgi:Na+/melibiose symporter-like transporter